MTALSTIHSSLSTSSLSVSAIAAEFGFHPYTVVRWILNGVKPAGPRGPRVYLQATKPGGRWRISRSDLDAFIDACTNAALRTAASGGIGQAPRAPLHATRAHQRAMDTLAAMGLVEAVPSEPVNQLTSQPVNQLTNEPVNL